MPGLTVLGNTECTSCNNAGYSIPRGRGFKRSWRKHARSYASNLMGCGCNGSCGKCKKSFQDSVNIIQKQMPYGVNMQANVGNANYSITGMLGSYHGTLQGEDEQWIKAAWEGIKQVWHLISGDECKRKADFKYPFNKSKRQTEKCLCAKASRTTTYTPTGGLTCFGDYGVDTEGNRDGLVAKGGINSKEVQRIMYFNKPFGAAAGMGTEIRLVANLTAKEGGMVYINEGKYEGGHVIEKVASSGGGILWIFIAKPFIDVGRKNSAGIPIDYPPSSTWASTKPLSELTGADLPRSGKKGAGLVMAAAAAIALMS